ncbi:SIS domain-containing protein [Natronosporangium hydrolyticum]|uniref:SIS domain-containing protein n=1 Tax=Natronosporangium hydrolyticum TaxID=2811111 RepID=A0A895YEA7_9ACTN|nr:SIS domain-containing protein [Natronosporangium hydrolyticum]QSB16127.1 SIS domain-containing protein [Natronosporangium hydrolyticum]
MNTTDPMAALYPFLADSGADTAPASGERIEELTAEVTASTAAKLREITALRRAVVAADAARIVECASAMAAAFAAGGRLFAMGNGGSATDAAELASLFVAPDAAGRQLPAYVLTGDVAAVTALSNDVGFEQVFARQLAAFARSGDIVVGLSTSGNSENLLAAFPLARERGLLTIGLSGASGGRMAELDSLDHLFVVPSASVHRIQEAQTTIYHVLWELTVAALRED